ncbi:MAG: hypothetical protein Q7R43_06500 [Candidatus Daviesbacteria bacterium]|nr:hypothetical protein [Candidatus Daviesbacteria bacterium]
MNCCLGKIKIYSLIFFLVIIINSWTWELLNQDLFLTIILLTITGSLFLLTFIKDNLWRKIILVILILVYGIGIFSLLNNHFDQSLREKNPTEMDIALRRHGFFAEGLGQLFTNKFSLNYYSNWYYPVSNYSRNISYSIDPNLYFFMSHPREKSGIDEFDKYAPFLLPFFIIGLLSYFLSLGKYKLLTIYLITAILLTGFITPHYKLGPVLLFPFVNLIIILGSLKILDYIGKKT